MIEKKPFSIDPILFQKPQEVLRWINSSSGSSGNSKHLKFIALLTKNIKFNELHYLIGYDEVAENRD